MTIENINELAKNVYSWSALFIKVHNSKNYPNARTLKKFRECYENEINYSHFTKNGIKKTEITKECPICGDEFLTNVGPRESTTCSHSCANTYFRAGINHPKFNGNRYRTICFHYHPKECIVCGENKIVEVHHYDENSKNDVPENLIPLCPNHHKYWHSKYKNEVEEIINNYIKKFIEDRRKENIDNTK